MDLLHMELSHKHHYVPVWYQRKFMHAGATAYHRLDLDPEIQKTPTGKVIKKGEQLTKGPKKCFYESELYTTEYFGRKNDDIEKHLFGAIDSTGKKVLDAIVSDNWVREIHAYFISFFEYMDAQRLRTPRGLHWLLQKIKSESYNELLVGMQYVRKMHCTMWTEAQLEIVSAAQSDIKFIVSDNPVTFYNPSCYPNYNYCVFPNDPGIHLKGTRTIFPLDLNHCAIITNTEYARSPGKLKELKTRTNPRLFDSTIANYADMIRGRELTCEEVLGINYILKSRAHRYIAAAEPEWLYPEKELTSIDWRKLNKILLSDKFSMIGWNREIFLGGADGRLIAAQDEFGRKPKTSQEWKEKEQQMLEMREHVEGLLQRERLKVETE